MTAGQQRYEVSQIFAEARVKGISPIVTIWLVLSWFDRQGISPPAHILDWLDEVPADQWKPVTIH